MPKQEVFNPVVLSKLVLCFACGACIAACPRDDAWRET